MKPLTIAVVAPGLDIAGGQEVQAIALVAALRDEGYDVTFVPTNPTFPRAFQRVRRWPYLRTLMNEAFYLPSLRRLNDVNVVHVFSASYWSFLLGPVPAIVRAHRLGKPTVLHYHSGAADDHLTRWRRVVKPWLQLVDEIVVPSEFLRTAFARHGYQSRAIPNVVDPSRFRYRDRDPLRPRLLSTRNFARFYRVDVTLRAFGLLKDRFPEATLTIVGDGAEAGQLRQLAAHVGGDAIRFVGRVDPHDMPRYYDEADIFVNASVVDNQPVSVLEAFASGLPVVSTPTGDIGAMIRDGENGRLIPANDPAAMASAVEGLLVTPNHSLQMTRRARQEVDKYTWPRVREAWAMVYEKVAA
jgi:glycosyltransferase involved in cell wall biosynthesis